MMIFLAITYLCTATFICLIVCALSAQFSPLFEDGEK